MESGKVQPSLCQKHVIFALDSTYQVTNEGFFGSSRIEAHEANLLLKQVMLEKEEVSFPKMESLLEASLENLVLV